MLKATNNFIYVVTLEEALAECTNFIRGACYEDKYDEARAQRLLSSIESKLNNTNNGTCIKDKSIQTGPGQPIG